MEYTTKEMADFLEQEFPQLKETFTRAEIEEALTGTEFFTRPDVLRDPRPATRRFLKQVRLDLLFPGLRLTDEQLDNYHEVTDDKTN